MADDFTTAMTALGSAAATAVIQEVAKRIRLRKLVVQRDSLAKKVSELESGNQTLQGSLDGLRKRLDATELVTSKIAQEVAERSLKGIKARIQSADPQPRVKWSESSKFQHQLQATAAAAESDEDAREIAKDFNASARLVVLVSGKGGVGKSTLALGLLEHYCRSSPAAVVDFDMHNRGLTSLLQAHVPLGAATSVLTELERFRPAFEKSGLTDADIGKGPFSVLHTKFSSLRDAFSQNDKLHTLRRLKTVSFDGSPIQVPGEDNPIRPENASFIPALKPDELFLSSSTFDAGFLEVYYFLRSLAFWAKSQANGIHTLIVDCHGAHDLFMIGAIHAATDLVIVTTPEPGSFDGTYDLVNFAATLQQNIPTIPLETTLVINNCRAWEEESKRALHAFYTEKSTSRPDRIIGIPYSDDTRSLADGYELGRCSKIADLWSGITAIAKTSRPPDHEDQGLMVPFRSSTATVAADVPESAGSRKPAAAT